VADWVFGGGQAMTVDRNIQGTQARGHGTRRGGRRLEQAFVGLRCIVSTGITQRRLHPPGQSSEGSTLVARFGGNVHTFIHY